MITTIHRCLKKPGLISRAKTYFVELNNQGLYLIVLGNATQVPNTRRGTLARVMANEAVKYWENKYEPELVASEKRIENGELQAMSKEKDSYFLEKSQVQSFTFRKQQDAIKVTIKSPVVSISLLMHLDYLPEIEAMAAKF